MQKTYSVFCIAIFIWSISTLAIAQPATEIYLFDLVNEDGTFSIKNPRNITKHDGYDNQPTFISDTEIVFSSAFGDQTDIVLYDISSKTQRKLSDTPESEFSPKPTKKGKYISAVVLTENGRQYISEYPIEKGQPKTLQSEQKIGYYCWYDKKTIFSYVVGSPPSLQEWNTKNAAFKIIMMNPGRSLDKIPNEKAISFIHEESESNWYFNRYSPENHNVTYITEIPVGMKDIAWQNDGILFASHQMKIMTFDSSKDDNWHVISNMADFELAQASRIAISPDGKLIAIVIDE